MEEQQARERIIAWAKEYLVGETQPDVEVVGIYCDNEFDVWDAELSVWYMSTSVVNPYRYITFTEDASCNHGIYVSQVEYA